jgi:hypothetical protein
VIAAKLRQLASYAARGRGSVRGMDETKQRTAETRGLRGAEAAAVLRFGLGEGAEPHSEGFGERSIRRTPLSTADAGASEWRSARAAAAGGITLAVLVAAGVGFPQSGTESPYADVARGSVSGPAVSAAGVSAGHRVGVIHKESEQMSILRNSAQASVVAGAALVAASAGAQSAAVQWKVSEGGNGHWYEFIRRSEIVCWPEARDASADKSGHLVTLASVAENEFVKSLVARHDPGVLEGGPFIGAFCGAGSWGKWSWVTAEPFSFTAWSPGEPNNAGDGECYVHYWRWSSLGWNDTSACSSQSFVVEWDADCNHDGIIDYGQCSDGTLKDYDGNNIPDCCERGDACVVGNYPVQWRIDDGGNGHWYQAITTSAAIGWTAARDRAGLLGGHLATVGSRAEDDVIARLALSPAVWSPNDRYGPWLGGYQNVACSASYANWSWVTGEPWNYVSDAGFFDNSSRSGGQCDDYLHYIDHRRDWNDVREDGDMGVRAFMVEWSADCNHDNIVDYGQILLGQLADTNTNGIPDICEVPTCADADLNPNGTVDGADLGALLAFWGPVSPAFPRADINGDGTVNGADLGILLSVWGPCGG